MTPQQQASNEAVLFVSKLNDIILFPLITLLSAIAFLVFLYGCSQYIFNATNESAREEGKKHITFGLIGLAIMMSAFALLGFAVNTFGLGKQLDCAKTPGASGCTEAFKLSI